MDRGIGEKDMREGGREEVREGEGGRGGKVRGRERWMFY